MTPPARGEVVVRALAPGVQVVVDLAAIVAHLRAQLDRLDPEARQELAVWIAALDGEGDRQAEAICQVSAAIGDVEGDGRWAWGPEFIYALAVPLPKGRKAAP